MIFKITKNIKFSKFYKKLNIIFINFIILSILFFLLKGLNLGVDFKGGTLIEIKNWEFSNKYFWNKTVIFKNELRRCYSKKFGKENDYLVKIELTKNDDKNFIQTINGQLSADLGSDVNFRRVENVGPKVSKELLKAGLLAISLSLAAMLFYIWIRFEWQFSLGCHYSNNSWCYYYGRNFFILSMKLIYQ